MHICMVGMHICMLGMPICIVGMHICMVGIHICMLMMIEHAEQTLPWPCDQPSQNDATYELVWKPPAIAGEYRISDAETMVYKQTTLHCEQKSNEQSWLDTRSSLNFLCIPSILVKNQSLILKKGTFVGNQISSTANSGSFNKNVWYFMFVLYPMGFQWLEWQLACAVHHGKI